MSADLVIQLNDEPPNIGETTRYSAVFSEWDGTVCIDESIANAIETVVCNLGCISGTYNVVVDQLGEEDVWWISISFMREKKKQLLKSDGRPYNATFPALAKRLLQEAIDRNLQSR